MICKKLLIYLALIALGFSTATAEDNPNNPTLLPSASGSQENSNDDGTQSLAPRLRFRRRDNGQKFALRSSDLLLKTVDAINSATSVKQASGSIIASLEDSVLDLSGTVIRRGEPVRIGFVTSPGTSFHRRAGTIRFSVEPITVEFVGQADQSGWTPGSWRISLSGTLHDIVIKGTGVVLQGDNEGEVRGRRSTSLPSQWNAPVTQGLSGLISFPFGWAIYGIGSAGEHLGHWVGGRSDLFIPEGSTLHFNLDNSGEAVYLGPTPATRPSTQ